MDWDVVMWHFSAEDAHHSIPPDTLLIGSSTSNISSFPSMSLKTRPSVCQLAVSISTRITAPSDPRYYYILYRTRSFQIVRACCDKNRVQTGELLMRDYYVVGPNRCCQSNRTT